MLGIHAATGPETLNELIGVVGTELRRLASEAPREAEVARSKAQLKVGLLMALESSAARVEQLARQVLAHGRVIASDELTARVDDVTPGAVRDLAARYARSRASVAVVGAGKRSLEFATRAASAVTA